MEIVAETIETLGFHESHMGVIGNAGRNTFNVGDQSDHVGECELFAGFSVNVLCTVLITEVFACSSVIRERNLFAECSALAFEAEVYVAGIGSTCHILG